ncbi:multidrug resistance-associated protein 4 [Elysia marginata]|uniref:Multidrug resistance-associated protein 4 n=1 Tax=Elysia marginata TaxID=1093978 RepID=A0AAV4JAV8_9GAST|nr:multidrug resistance-associated protein 4 [Elysia marginata]
MGAIMFRILSKLHNFLLLEELNSLAFGKQSTEPTASAPTGDKAENQRTNVVEITNLSPKWEENSTTLNTLDNISLTVTPGQLVAVIGPVGAGKTSLLMSILGELPAQTGAVYARGKIAYVSQHPWIFSGSLRQNILFGQGFEKPRYDKIIRMTALTRDLTVLPKGDATLIGDRGVNLSGGQKARVSLARALYMDADIYLLDDPLAAVDTTVGKHIFDKCIVKYLENKARILVTHQVQLLPAADSIFIITSGKKIREGTYEELSVSGVDFPGLLKPPEGKKLERGWQNQRSSLEAQAEHCRSTLHDDYRRCSVLSVDSLGLPFVPDFVQLPDEEERETGNIDLKVFIGYFKAGAGIILFGLMVVFLLLGQVFLVGCDVWLARWYGFESSNDFVVIASIAAAVVVAVVVVVTTVVLIVLLGHCAGQY